MVIVFPLGGGNGDDHGGSKAAAAATMHRKHRRGPRDFRAVSPRQPPAIASTWDVQVTFRYETVT